MVQDIPYAIYYTALPLCPHVSIVNSRGDILYRLAAHALTYTHMYIHCMYLCSQFHEPYQIGYQCWIQLSLADQVKYFCMTTSRYTKYIYIYIYVHVCPRHLFDDLLQIYFQCFIILTQIFMPSKLGQVHVGMAHINVHMYAVGHV